MISRFFIDRPIFATVLSVVITLIGGIALLYLPVAQYPRITPPGVVVSISYPGASSQVVADTVAAPIEQQVNGVQGMLYMSSQSGNDGSYSLTVTFDIGTDLKTALVMVQNRVALAMPQLPTEVQNQGITIRKKTPDILMIVNFYSPDGRYDDIYLSNFATLNVKDELLRVEGVSDITYQGQRDYSVRAWLDPQKLAARNMTAMDVATAIRAQNLDAPAGQVGQTPSLPGQSFQLPIDTLGRLRTPEEFGNIVIKVGQSRFTQTATGVAVPPQSGAPTSSSGTKQSSQTGSSGNSSGTGDTTTTPSSSSTSTSTFSSPAYTPGGATSSTPSTTGGAMSTGPASLGSSTTPAPANNNANTSSQSTSAMMTGNAAGPGVIAGTTFGRGPGRPSAALVRLRDVARIEVGAQNYNMACTFDGHPSVGLSVYQLPGTNALDVANAVRKKMRELKERFPNGVEYEIGYDTTPYIRDSVTDVLKTLIEAVVLVGFVVLFFLQDWRAMVLPMIDVPVSLIGTCAVMAALGFSLNNISLFGLVLTIGIVVDDAIVVLENIERLIATGLDARTATIKAMDEVTGPIIAVALVLCSVFIPCAIISGITGQFFRQFAVTIAVSTVISAINAITMTPSRAVLLFKTEPGTRGHAHKREALPWWIFAAVGGIITMELLPGETSAFTARVGISSWPSWAIDTVAFLPGALAGGVFGWLLIRPINAGLGWLFRGFNNLFDRTAAGYGWVVGKGMRLSAVVLLMYAGLFGLTYVVFQRAPTGFIPQQDQGRLIVNIQLPDSSSLERTQAAVAEVDRIARETKGVAHTVCFSGLSFLLQANSPNFASMFIVLDPFADRQSPGLRDTAIMARLRKAWNEKVKDAQVTVFGAAPIPGLGVAGGFKAMIEDRGGLGPQALQKAVEELIQKLKANPGLTGVTTQFRSNTPQLFLDIDRTKAASLGVALNDINQTLDMYLGSLYVNSYNDFGRHWQVTIQAEGRFRDRVENINDFQVRNDQGLMVPLGTLVRPREVGGPIAITRYNLYTAAAINGNIQLGTSTGDAIAAIDKEAGETLPLSMKADWTELMFMQKRAGNTAFHVFLLSVVFVFLGLAGLYESWTLPLAVILVVPLCLLCSVAGVLWTNRDVNIFVQIGLVVLVGLACKNAILVVEYAKQLHQDGRSVFEATQEASRLRLRPILMTSFAFIFGVVPLVIASGAGAEMRRSLGTAVFSGMLGVTLFGIFLTPVFFYVIQGFGETRFFANPATRFTFSCVLGALLGLVAGYSLAQLSVIRLVAGLVLGPCAGGLAVVAVLGIHRGFRILTAPPNPAATPGVPVNGNSDGGHQS
jgi:multidrug efflux pump subunit AcrB